MVDLIISVVIPFYNRSKYLEKAVKSVLDQTNPHWELILVNDGSNDTSLEIAQSFADPRIRIITHTSNRGNAFARNEGWKGARHSWVAYLDSDDWYEPDYLERMAKAIKTSLNVDFFWTGVRFVDGMGITKKEEFWKPLASLPSDTFFDQLRIGTNAGVCFSREVLTDFGGFEEKLRASVDREFFIRISQIVSGQGVEFIGVNCLIGTHESVRKSFRNQADAYDFLCEKYEKQIESMPIRSKWWYHKAMWLNLYSGNTSKAFKYLSKIDFNPKSLLLFLVFFCFPNSVGRKFHKKLAG